VLTLAPDPESPHALVALDQEHVEARSLPRSPIAPREVREAGWTVQDLWLPAVVCAEDAVRHNLDRFAEWCRAREVSLAPHGKTTMAPALWSAQLQRGAWGITAATVAQVRTMRHHRVPRVLLANEVVDPEQVSWLASAAGEPDFEVMCLVDSPRGVDLLADAAREAGVEMPVLVEVGVPGRRTGARGQVAVIDLAQRVADAAHLRLAGVEGYEGVWPTLRTSEAVSDARSWLDEVAEVVEECDRLGLFAGPEVVVTAGGSAFVDLVVEAFAPLGDLSHPVRRVVRSGCYVSHDHVSYEGSSPLRSAATDDPLRPALTCRAAVLSTPESGRSLLGVGKRDVAFDSHLPVPLTRERGGLDLDALAVVVELNDHHGFLDHEPGLFEVGDVVELGLSHPCTVFDKWTVIPVVNADGGVVGAIRTVF